MLAIYFFLIMSILFVMAKFSHIKCPSLIFWIYVSMFPGRKKKLDFPCCTCSCFHLLHIYFGFLWGGMCMVGRSISYFYFEVFFSQMLPLLKLSLAQTVVDNWNPDTAFISGSGKTFTMQPLPLRAAEDLVRLLHQPVYRNQRFKLWLSFFEIYGGKLFDLLSERKLVFPCFLLVYFICLLTSRVFRTSNQLDSICNGVKMTTILLILFLTCTMCSLGACYCDLKSPFYEFIWCGCGIRSNKKDICFTIIL